MPISAFFAFLAKALKSASTWLKIYFFEKGQAKEATPENLVKFGRIKADGDVNVTNINVNLVVDPTSEEYSKDKLREILEEASRQVSEHSGLALGISDTKIVEGVEGRAVLPLTDIQKNQVNKFSKAGWGRDKISSVIIAFRIINAEDTDRFREAEQLMDSAFTGRKGVINRKMYNLARSGYLERFAFDLLISAQYTTDKAISRILDYFPDAIFLDYYFLEEDLNAELVKREQEDVKQVSVYARSKRRVEIMERGYKQYLISKGDSTENTSTKMNLVYVVERKMLYKLGDSEAETLDLRLKSIRSDDLKEFDFRDYH